MKSTDLSKIFNSISKSLGENDSHFKRVKITLTENGTLNDNSFGDITFDSFSGEGINKISNKAFGKSSDSIQSFWCEKCWLENHSPKYNFWNVFGQMNQLTSLTIDLNVNEIPSNAFKTANQSQLGLIEIRSSKQNLTIKSNAFNNLKNLVYIFFVKINFNRFEKQSLNFDSNSLNQNEKILIEFISSNLNGDSFEPGTFDGVKRPIGLEFFADFDSNPSEIKVIPESVFKSLLNNTKSSINSRVDCLNCKNYWLIRDHKQQQLKYPFCTEANYSNRTLFHQEIQTKLKSKCN